MEGLISQPYPHEIDKDFRSELGRINPLFCLLDVATARFASELASGGHPAEFIRAEAKRFDHHRLYTDAIKFTDSRRFLFVSHIAFLLTCAEAACRRLQRHPIVNKNELNKNEGDFVRRTVRIVLLTATGENVLNPAPLRDIHNLIGEAAFATVDYYRLVRNAELHARHVEDRDRSPDEAHQSLPIDSIVREYKRRPSTPLEIQFSDVLLCSLALQDMVRRLCAGLLGVDNHIIPHLLKAFGVLPKKRRANAAFAFCQQELLLDEHQAKSVIESIGWLA